MRWFSATSTKEKTGLAETSGSLTKDRRKSEILYLGRNNFMHLNRLWANWLESILAEKGLGHGCPAFWLAWATLSEQELS